MKLPPLPHLPRTVCATLWCFVWVQPVPLPLTALTRPVTALLFVQFGWKCAANPTASGSLPATLSQCNATAIVTGSRTDTSVQMYR